MLAVTSRRAIMVGLAATIVSGVLVRCPTGTRVYSLTVYSGSRLDGLIMRCTGDGDEQTIPQEFNDDPGGVKEEGICAGTGGLQGMRWKIPQYSIMVYLNITCMDNSTYHFADGRSYDAWNITGDETTSCDEGEYVQGISYYADYPEGGLHSYYLNSMGFICSSSTLDPICTDCSGDTTPRADEDQPEYCELPNCSEEECCESIGDEEAESITTDVVIGIVSTVAAAMILSCSAWSFHRCRDKNLSGKGVETAPRI